MMNKREKHGEKNMNCFGKRILAGFGSMIVLLGLLLSLTGCGRTETPITAIEQLNGKRVAVERGTLYADLLRKREELPDTQIIYVSSTADGLAELMGKKADAFVIDYVMAQRLLRKYDGLGILNETLDEAAYGFAFQKGDPLQETFNEAIRGMKADGRLNAMEEKWLGDDDSMKSVPEQTWPGTNGTLQCRCNPGAEPMCYRENGELVGLDIDVLLHVAEEMDCRIAFTECEFDDLLPSLAAGQFDCAVSGITITADRRERVDFSESYLSASSVIMVLDGSKNTERAGFFMSLGNSLRRVMIEDGRWLMILKGIGVTILVAVLSAVLGVIFGCAIYLWDYSGSKIAHVILSAINWIITMIPGSTWLLIVFYLIFAGNSVSGFWSAVVALGIMYGFSVFGALNGNVGQISVGQTEAAYSMGYSRFGALFRIFLPQALPGVFGSLQGATIGHVKMTALVGMIAVQDLQAIADLIRAETFEPFVPLILTAVCYMLLAWGSSTLIGRMKLRVTRTNQSENKIKERVMKGKI